jgi:hypothetical protein
MKVIFAARKALAAYLMSSALCLLVNNIGVSLIEWAVDLTHHLTGADAVASNHRAIWSAKIFNRRAFAEKFWVACHAKIGLRRRHAN